MTFGKYVYKYIYESGSENSIDWVRYATYAPMKERRHFCYTRSLPGPQTEAEAQREATARHPAGRILNNSD